MTPQMEQVGSIHKEFQMCLYLETLVEGKPLQSRNAFSGLLTWTIQSYDIDMLFK